MDERGESVTRIPFHPLPHVQYGTAGGIHHHASEGAELLKVSDGHTERRKDDHITRCHSRKIERALIRFGIMGQKNDPHLTQLLIDVWIVDDLASKEDAPLREFLARLVGVFNSALDAVAKAELASKADRGPVCSLPCGKGVVPRLDEIDEPPVVVRGQIDLDVRFETESLTEIRRLARRERGGDRVGHTRI
jgi:hypothetical protein